MGLCRKVPGCAGHVGGEGVIMDIVAVINSVAPGALPAAAIVFVWWKLDRRILELEVLFKRLPCNFDKECEK